MMCFGLVEATISPLFVPFLQGTLHATATQIGLAASAQSFTLLGAGLAVVAVANRLGATRMFVIGAAGAAVAVSGYQRLPQDDQREPAEVGA
jgi:Na+/melibiose symporter-like transporter